MVIAEAVVEILNFVVLHYLYFLTPVLALFAYLYWWESQDFVKEGNRIPGPPTLPIVGNCHQVRQKDDNVAKKNDILGFVRRNVQQYGKTVRFWFGGRLVIGLFDPKDIEQVFGNGRYVIEKASDYAFYKSFLGDGLLLTSAGKQKDNRQLLDVSSKEYVAKTLVPSINRNSKDLLGKIRIAGLVGEIMDIYDFESECVLDCLLNAVLGVKRTSGVDTWYEYSRSMTEMKFLLQKRSKIHFARCSFLYKNFHGKVYEEEQVLVQKITSIIADLIEKRKALQPEKDQAKSILDLIIERDTDNKLTTAEVRDEVNSLILEAHITTSIATSFVFCLLANHPQLAKDVQKEVDKICEQKKPTDLITAEDASKMVNLDMVILETLRKYPPIPAISRRADETITLPGSIYKFPKGASISIAPYLLHRDPDHYPNPEHFNPDNFLPERVSARHPFAYLPFGVGPRIGINKEFTILFVKIAVATVLRSFRLQSLVHERDFEIQSDVSLGRADGFRIILQDKNAPVAKK